MCHCCDRLGFWDWTDVGDVPGSLRKNDQALLEQLGDDDDDHDDEEEEAALSVLGEEEDEGFVYDEYALQQGHQQQGVEPGCVFDRALFLFCQSRLLPASPLLTHPPRVYMYTHTRTTAAFLLPPPPPPPTAAASSRRLSRPLGPPSCAWLGWGGGAGTPQGRGSWSWRGTAGRAGATATARCVERGYFILFVASFFFFSFFFLFLKTLRPERPGYVCVYVSSCTLPTCTFPPPHANDELAGLLMCMCYLLSVHTPHPLQQCQPIPNRTRLDSTQTHCRRCLPSPVSPPVLRPLLPSTKPFTSTPPSNQSTD